MPNMSMLKRKLKADVTNIFFKVNAQLKASACNLGSCKRITKF